MSGSPISAGRAVGPAPEDGVQHRRRIDRRALRVRRDELAEPIEQRTGDAKPDLDAVLVADVEQRSLDLPAQVPGDPIRRLSAVQRSLVDRQPLGQLVELSPQPLGDEQLVQTRPQLRHGPTLRSGAQEATATQARRGERAHRPVVDRSATPLCAS